MKRADRNGTTTLLTLALGAALFAPATMAANTTSVDVSKLEAMGQTAMSSTAGGPDVLEGDRQLADAVEAVASRFVGDRAQLVNWTTDFYAANGNTTVWTDRVHWGSNAAELVEALTGAERHGLDPEDYLAFELARSIEKTPAEMDQSRLSETDVMATMAYLAYARDMKQGRYQGSDLAARVKQAFGHSKSAPDVTRDLVDGLNNRSIAKGLEGLAPAHPQYRQLQRVLSNLRASTAADITPVTLDARALRVGDTDRGVPALREALAEKCGDCDTWLVGPMQNRELYDENLASAVEAFQKLNGLKEDGIAGSSTLEILNLTTAEKIKRVTLNMDRWRWMPEDLGERHVFVNIPEYQVRIMNGGQEELNMRVIVGTERNPTPIFSDAMEYAVFRPYWHVPYSIASEEILPKVQENPNYLTEQNYQVVRDGEVLDPGSFDWSQMSAAGLDVRFRQEAGPGNALGLVKFIFPNEYAIYLHDTPNDSLFSRSNRALSHGCIRLHEPARFAEAILNITQDDANQLMRAGDQKVMHLAQEIPVHIGYFSVTANEDGEAIFHPDVYELDSAAQSWLAEQGRDLDEISTLAANYGGGANPRAALD